MRNFLVLSFQHMRTSLLMLALIVVVGSYAYLAIPRESNPDVAIPMIYVSATLEGASPEDIERLLVKPLEKELTTIKGLKSLQGIAAEGHGSLIVEFDVGFDSEKAYRDVQDKIDNAIRQLPQEADKPIAQEINVALFPIVSVLLSGELPENELLVIARRLQDELERLKGVLEVNILGDREDVVEAVIEPAMIEAYQLSLEEVVRLVANSNQMLSAGSIENSQGRLLLKIPSSVESIGDYLATPIAVRGDQVITLSQVATLRRTFKDRTTLARLDGQNAIALEVKKRIGENIITTVDEVKRVINMAQTQMPRGVTVTFQQDESKMVQEMVSELENNVVAAILIVVAIMMIALGIRSSLLVCIAIPGSFLIGIALLYWLGYTLNMITLFSLILVAGMLVDDAIVVTELADRKMVEGMTPREAYAYATQRMLWPITAATMTKLVVFFPLLFWPGIVGDFMKYMPITVILTLIASWVMAMVFIPILGALFGKVDSQAEQAVHNAKLAEEGDLSQIRGLTGKYLYYLDFALQMPWRTLLVAIFSVILIFITYARFGKGVEFFPDIEPDFAQIQVRARGDLSLEEKSAIVREVEQLVIGTTGIKSVYSSVLGMNSGGSNSKGGRQPPDTIGILQLEFTPWQTRPPARQILADLRQKLEPIPGIILNFQESEQGPGQGLPIQLEVSSQDEQFVEKVVWLTEQLESIEGVRDVRNDLPVPGIEWRLNVDKSEAVRYGVDLTSLGGMVRMMTSGALVSKYRPADVDDEVDLRVRLPVEMRHLQTLDTLTLLTNKGQVPLSHFMNYEPKPLVTVINRVDGRRVFKVEADLEPDMLTQTALTALWEKLKNQPQLDNLYIKVKGEAEDTDESQKFLVNAFGLALFLMLIVLVAEFNSFYQAFLVMSAIVISCAGVLLGMLITDQPFGIVMGGIGMIALAGIVVNNNIVLIDAYNAIRQRGEPVKTAILRACAQRMRPVLLTSLTTILGLMPMVLQWTVNFTEREFSIGAPSTQWWTQLSGSIAGGMSFATLLTLIVTPCLLMVGEQTGQKIHRIFNNVLHRSKQSSKQQAI